MNTMLFVLLFPLAAYCQPSAIIANDVLGAPVGTVRPLGTLQSKLGSGSLAITVVLQPGETAIVTSAYDSIGLATDILVTGAGFPTEHGRIDVTNRIGTTAGNVSCSIASIKPVTNSYSASLQLVLTGSPAASAMSAWAVKGTLELDKFSTNSGTGTTPTSNATALGTTANQFLIAVVALEGPNTDSVGIWSSAILDGQKDGTSGGGDASNCSITDGYLLLSSPGRSNVGSKTGMANRDWAAAVATYKFK